MAPPRFDGERFRTQIKLAKYRLENLAKQLKNASSTRRREIATLLQQGLEDRARVNQSDIFEPLPMVLRNERLFNLHQSRDDFLLEAYEMLLVACEDLIQSAGIIIRESQLDPDLVGPCKSIIYACGRIEAPELDRVRDQLVTKFGSAVGDVTSEEGRASVDSSLIVKLSIRNPDLNLSYKYMAAIAECYGISWKPSSCNLTTSNILINEVNGPALNSNWSVEQKKTLLNSNLDQSIPVVGGQSPPLSNANDDSPTDQDVRHADNPPPYSPSHSEMTPPPHNNTLESRSTSAPSFEELSERLKALKRR